VFSSMRQMRSRLTIDMGEVKYTFPAQSPMKWISMTLVTLVLSQVASGQSPVDRELATLKRLEADWNTCVAMRQLWRTSLPTMS
jgi:hypothetical protein